MNLRKTLLRFFVLAAIFAAPTAKAQQVSSDRAQLVLEVHFYPNEPPAYQTIPPSRRSGAWYARFGRVRGWTPAPDSLAVTAVDIKSELAEDGIRVWVSVFLGPMHEQQPNVASYLLHEGEKATVRELSQFGVVPFDIAVVRVNPSIAPAPQFVSKAKSIEVAVMQANVSTLPSYEVVIRNLSLQSVSALQVQVLQGGRPRVTSMPQGKDGQPLILPGGTYQYTTRLAIKAAPKIGGYTPELLPDQTVEVSTAVFDDGSFEGDSEPAIAFTAFQKGRKIQLARVVEAFQKALETDNSTALGSLRADVTALGFSADSSAVEEVRSKFPNQPENTMQRVKTAIEIGMKGARDLVLEDIVQFQLRNRRSTDPNALRNWLNSSKERYESWLGRLQVR